MNITCKIFPVTATEFDRILRNVASNRTVYLDEPSGTLNNNVYLWSDKKDNWYLLYKSIEVGSKKKTICLKCSQWSATDAPSEEIVHPGQKAWNKYLKFAKKYNEDMCYKDNAKLDEQYKTDHFEWINNKVSKFKWYRAIAFDMHKCYWSYFDKPLPGNKLVGENRLAGEDELGFNLEPKLSSSGDLELMITLNTSKNKISKWVFKKVFYKSLVEYSKHMEKALIKLNKDSNEYAIEKKSYEAFLGYIKRKNIFLRAAILGYSKEYMENLRMRFNDRILQMTVDSVVTTDLDFGKNLPLGDHIGEFGIEHDGYFIAESKAKSGWYQDVTRYKGENKFKFIDWNHEYITHAWRLDIDFSEHLYRIEFIKDRSIKVLWPELNQSEAKNNSQEFMDLK